MFSATKSILPPLYRCSVSSLSPTVTSVFNRIKETHAAGIIHITDAGSEAAVGSDEIDTAIISDVEDDAAVYEMLKRVKFPNLHSVILFDDLNIFKLMPQTRTWVLSPFVQQYVHTIPMHQSIEMIGAAQFSPFISELKRVPKWRPT